MSVPASWFIIPKFIEKRDGYWWGVNERNIIEVVCVYILWLLHTSIYKKVTKYIRQKKRYESYFIFYFFFVLYHRESTVGVKFFSFSKSYARRSNYDMSNSKILIETHTLLFSSFKYSLFTFSPSFLVFY